MIMWESIKYNLYSVLALACILNSCHAECQPGQDSEGELIVKLASCIYGYVCAACPAVFCKM